MHLTVPSQGSGIKSPIRLIWAVASTQKGRPEMDNQSDLQTLRLEVPGLSIVDEATGDESTRSSNSPFC